MRARRTIENLIQEIAPSTPAPTFSDGDVIMPLGGKYPADAMTVHGDSAAPLGGGFMRKIKDPRRWRKVTPDEMQTGSALRPGVFYGDWAEAKYPGLHSGQRWNGWAQPYFTREVAQRVIDDINNSRTMASNAEDAVYDAAKDAFLVDDGEGNIETFSGEDISGQHLYDFGGGWCWSVDDNDDDEA